VVIRPDGSKRAIRIVVADDHRIVRVGLRALLGFESDFDLIGEAADGLEVLEMVRTLEPDILVLDLMMPGMNGLEVTARLNTAQNRPGIVILSMHSDQAYVLEALRSGARGYVLKDNTSEELVMAIREVQAGRVYLGATIPAEIKLHAGLPSADPLKPLTDREREIFQLAVRGLSNIEIGAALTISPKTVETHFVSINRKLRVANRSQLVNLGVKRGLLTSSQVPADASK
jgi:two-component system, NarL family, response regulator NreC